MSRACSAAGPMVALLLLGLAASRCADEGGLDRKKPMRECQDFFESINHEVQVCADGLADRAAGAPAGNGTDAAGCPLMCRDLFQDMPLYCGRLVDAALEPNYTASLLVRNGQPVDICTTFCGSGELCTVDRTLLPRLDLLRWLPDLTSPVWALVALKGSGGGGGKQPSPPDDDDDSGVNVAAVVAGSVVGAVVLAAAAFIAGRLWQARHRRQQAVAAAPPAAAGDGGKDSLDLELGWAKQQSMAQRDSQDTDVDSPSTSACGPPSAADTRLSSPDGLDRLADLWAQAVRGAAPQPAARALPAAAGEEREAAVEPHDSAFQASAQRHIGWTGSAASAAASAATSDAAVPDTSGTALQRIASRRSTGALASTPTAEDLERWEVDFSALTLVRTLGEGSAGKVYLGTMNETSVAVKVLADTSGASAAGSWASSPALQALHRESSVMAALRHPNVVLFLGISYEPPAIISEYCARGSLFDVLRSAGASEATAASLTWQRRLCLALDAAKGMLALHSHQPPIIHRDLKSPNLLVDGAWRCKVADFNLSKLLEDTGVRSTSLGGMLNPRWLAPEVLTGGSATAASDTFSMGVVLWELLTWAIPWGDRNAFQLVHTVSAGERLAVPAREAVAGAVPDPELYEAYVALTWRCWAQRPEDRPGFAEIIQDLRAMLG